MEFVIPKEIIGSEQHLHCLPTGFTCFVDKIPYNTLVINSERYFTILKLYKKDVPEFPSQKYRLIFQKLLPKVKDIPWEKTIKKDSYDTEINKFISEIKESLEGVSFEYYDNSYTKNSLIFESLRPAKINTSLFASHISNLKKEEASQKQCILSFCPTNGYAAVASYDRTSSKTGRLVTDFKSPKILNLKKNYRSIIDSRFGKNGKIYEFDFRSLEPRVLLSINGEKEIPEDVYEHIIQKTNISVSRDLVKQIVLSRLFGAGERMLEGLLISSGYKYNKKTVETIDEYFGITKLKQKLEKEFDKNKGKYIENYYGRYIECQGAAPYVLLNYYIQSTAVDVAMNGFYNIVFRLKTANLIDEYVVPIFVLHDAIWIDIKNNFESIADKICKAGSSGITEFEDVNFFLKSRIINGL